MSAFTAPFSVYPKLSSIPDEMKVLTRPIMVFKILKNKSNIIASPYYFINLSNKFFTVFLSHFFIKICLLRYANSVILFEIEKTK